MSSQGFSSRGHALTAGSGQDSPSLGREGTQQCHFKSHREGEHLRGHKADTRWESWSRSSPRLRLQHTQTPTAGLAHLGESQMQGETSASPSEGPWPPPLPRLSWHLSSVPPQCGPQPHNPLLPLFVYCCTRGPDLSKAKAGFGRTHCYILSSKHRTDAQLMFFSAEPTNTCITHLTLADGLVIQDILLTELQASKTLALNWGALHKPPPFMLPTPHLQRRLLLRSLPVYARWEREHHSLHAC